MLKFRSRWWMPFFLLFASQLHTVISACFSTSGSCVEDAAGMALLQQASARFISVKDVSGADPLSEFTQEAAGAEEGSNSSHDDLHDSPSNRLDADVLMRQMQVSKMLAELARAKMKNDEHTEKSIKENQSRTRKNVEDMMWSTPEGVCMYKLPPRFNTGLLNSEGEFDTGPVPDGSRDRPDWPQLRGMTNSTQFCMERIFYDRMNLAATQIKHFSECKLFYVPYFVSWEATKSHYAFPCRPSLDNDMFSHLGHWNSTTIPGSNHFVVVSRVIYEAGCFLEHPMGQQIIKLTFDSSVGQYPNTLAIPYPTWFRYYPRLERPVQVADSTIMVISSKSIIKESDAAGMPEGCTKPWDLTQQLKAECDGHEYCSIFIPQETKAPLCPHEVLVTYKCGFKLEAHFRTRVWRPASVFPPMGSGQEAPPGSSGSPVVLSCRNGPCWLHGKCAKARMRQVVASGDVQDGPLVSLVGSARSRERLRLELANQCLHRPSLCVLYNTGIRENFSNAFEDRSPEMYQVLLASTFCINPIGDTYTRKAIFDALTVGCIPVVFHEKSLDQYHSHLPLWRSVSLFIPDSKFFKGDDFNLIDFLAAYAKTNPQEVREKQEAIGKVAYSLQYSWGPDAHPTWHGPDAFDKTLAYLLSRQ